MIRLEKLCCRQGRRLALSEITGSFPPGLTALAGPNGAGKTTLLRAMAGLHPVASGSIDLGGLGRSDIALLPQAAKLDRRFPVTCADLVALGAWTRIGALRHVNSAYRHEVSDALDAMGLAGLEDRMIEDLSAGQFQRVLFARLMLQNARIVLLDEPMTAVDTATEEKLRETILRWGDEGRIVIAALHDNHMILRDYPRTLLLSCEVVAWGASAIALSAAHRQQARRLAEARDSA
jgi:zinc/manganese transport system ATP-binding protein